MLIEDGEGVFDRLREIRQDGVYVLEFTLAAEFIHSVTAEVDLGVVNGGGAGGSCLTVLVVEDGEKGGGEVFY